jgi:hypothetical protein
LYDLEFARRRWRWRRGVNNDAAVPVVTVATDGTFPFRLGRVVLLAGVVEVLRVVDEVVDEEISSS